LRLDIRGLEYDPGNVFVKCTECGSLLRLLDVGLSPKDLLPPGSEHDLAAAGLPKVRR
jgi:hypothetical protein